MRKKILAGNWKMHKGPKEAGEFVEALLKNLGETSYEIVVAPPFVSIPIVTEVLKRNEKKIKLAAQNVHWEREGAYTGEISAPMLKELDVDYVIIGHSERRKYFKEDDSMINNKVKAALQEDIQVILCVGETLEEREKGIEKEVVREQLERDLESLVIKELEKVVIAYEPVWAIGTGKTATPEEAERMHRFIREVVEKIWGEVSATSLTILYGGSVKPENIRDLTAMEDIDGALIGGASLKLDSFLSIVNNAF